MAAECTGERQAQTATRGTVSVRWAEGTTEALRSRRFNPESESEQRTVGDLVDRLKREKLPQLASTQNRRKLTHYPVRIDLDQISRLC